jgi:hypothetical protein
MALNRYCPSTPAAGRQAIFLGATKPRGAPPKGALPRVMLVGQGRLALSTLGNSYIDANLRRAKNLSMTIEISGGMLRAARSLAGA